MVMSPDTDTNLPKPSKLPKSGLVLIVNAPACTSPVRPSIFVMIALSEISTEPALAMLSNPSRFSSAVFPVICKAPSIRASATSGSRL